MDFRELNTHIEVIAGDSEIYAQKLSDWRRQGASVTMLDLKRAYLQIRVDELWEIAQLPHGPGVEGTQQECAVTQFDHRQLRAVHKKCLVRQHLGGRR
uniref:Reverse transcriptase domain-containing protein n=1 Tax=Trichuris muris TaxID=70415 RepID=A0A5S6QWA5_TRIMR